MYTDAYADAIRPEQVEKAIFVAVVTRFNSPHMSLEDCVASAVDLVFCPCVSHVDGAGEWPPLSIRANLVESMVGLLRGRICSVRADREVPLADDVEERELVARKRRQDGALDDALAQTFPASDPVAALVFD